jgi:hypothetical protein
MHALEEGLILCNLILIIGVPVVLHITTSDQVLITVEYCLSFKAHIV